MQRAGLGFLCLALGLLSSQREAAASIVRALDLAELTARADQIVVGDIVDVRSDWDSSHRTIFTTVDVLVRESWKGGTPKDARIHIRQLGGTVGDIEMTVHGMPAFSLGERALLFLGRTGVVGMSQGKRALRRSASDGTWQVSPPDRRGLLLAGPSARDRKTPEKPESLESLRSRVRALLGK
jgi:hypothetical protein